MQINAELCRLTGVKCSLTSAYHPQSNGLYERFNHTLQRQLLKFVSEEQEQWDLYLDSMLFSYRVSRQDSTRYSPFFLVYGRQARLPLEFNINDVGGEDSEDSDVEDGAQDVEDEDSDGEDSGKDVECNSSEKKGSCSELSFEDEKNDHCS